MSDVSRQKNGPRVPSRGPNSSQSSMSSQNARSFSPQANLEAQVTATPSLVTSAKDAWSWLESKGWILNSEDNTNSKLSDVLLAATLSFKLTADASTAIRSVAFLLRAHADKSFTSSVADQLIDKVINKINGPLAELNKAVNATKHFLDVATQKQAAELLTLQDSIKQQSELVKLLTDASEKASLTTNPRNLVDTVWPPLPASGGVAFNSDLPSAPQSAAHANPKVAQRVALTAKQLLIEYGPLEEGEVPRPKTIEAQRDLHQLFNDWIDATTAVEADGEQLQRAPSRAVRNISIFDRPTFLLKFNSTESKDKFTEMIDNNNFLLSKLGPKAHIRPCTFAVIFWFVPCNGPFDPSLDENLQNLERENDLPHNSIVAVSWCKHPDRRSPNQTTSMLKVACANPDIANHLVTGHIRVDDHLVTVTKDLRIPIRCIKCQDYGHTQDTLLWIYWYIPLFSFIIYSLNYFSDIFSILLFKSCYLEATHIFLCFSH